MECPTPYEYLVSNYNKLSVEGARKSIEPEDFGRKREYNF